MIHTDWLRDAMIVQLELLLGLFSCQQLERLDI